MLQAYISLGFEVLIKNRLRTAALLSGIRKHSGLYHFDITDAQIKRIIASTILSSLTNNWFSTLAGCKTGTDALQKAIYLGALTPILDGLTDDFGFCHAEIFERKEGQRIPASNQIQLAHYLYDQVMKDQDEVFSRYFNEVIHAQDISLKQLQKSKLPFEELHDISRAKGGYSTLLYRAVLRRQLISGEKEAIYLLGGILQLTNDAFDVYKDYKAGQQTLFTNTEDVGKLRVLYVELIHEMFAKFLALEYTSENKRQALLKIAIILSRGIVCLDQLMACQKRTGDKFMLGQYARADLICDMEKLSNIIKSVKIFNSLKEMIDKEILL